MLSTNQDDRAVEGEIMRAVKEAKGASAPADLIRTLKRDGFAENSIRAAMWDLIDGRHVSVTGDLKLKPTRR